MRIALEHFLEGQTWAAYQLEPARQPFSIYTADDVDIASDGVQDGADDVSSRTGHYLAEALHRRG